MNIVYLRSNPVNPDPRVEKEVYSLLKHGHQVTILCWDRSELPLQKDEINVLGKTVPVIRWSKKSEFGGGVKNIFKLILFQVFLTRSLIRMRKQFDAIHAADFDTVLPGLLLKVFCGKKLVYDIFDFYVDSFPVPKFLKPIVRSVDFFVIRMSDALILTNETRQRQVKGSLPRRLVFIHNTPIEFSPIKSRAANDGFDITLVYVGILQPGRLLLEIMEVVIRHPRWRFVIAGFGSLEGKIRNYSLKYSNITFYGLVSYAKSLELSASADVLFATYDPLVPNHLYSSPNKLYEAMMLAKPIIVCKSTGIDEVVEKNFIGLSIAYDAKAFERAVIYLIENRDRTNMMALNSRTLYERDYSWQIMENRLINLYENI